MTLEIHVINVSQGDSILIINRDLNKLRENLDDYLTMLADEMPAIDLLPFAMKKDPGALQGTVKKALLIDAGEAASGEDVVEYLMAQGAVPIPKGEGVMNADKLSVLMSHYHSDHIGGLPHLFFKRKKVPTTITVKPRNRKSYKRQVMKNTDVPRYRPKYLYFTEKSKKDNRIKAYKEVFKWADMSSYITQVPVRRGGLALSVSSSRSRKKYEPLVIELGEGVEGIPILLRAVAAKAYVWDVKNEKRIKVETKKTDPNDRSIVLVLEYGSFRGFFGGDIAGNGLAEGGNGKYSMNVDGKRHFSQHGDVESVLMPALEKAYPKTDFAQRNKPKFSTAGHCTFYKVSHHGSSSSNDIHTLGRTTPRVAVISSGLKTRFHRHPTEEVMRRLDEAQWTAGGEKINNTTSGTSDKDCGIFITEIAECARGNDFSVDVKRGSIVGDVIVRPLDETIKNAQKSDKLGNTITVQVYGSGIQTLLDPSDEGNTLRSNKPKPKYDSLYAIGPFTFNCNEH